MFEYDKHFRDCLQNNMPFIKAKTNPATGYYYVQIDLMPCDRAFTKEGKDKLEKLFQNESMSKHATMKKSTLPDYSIEDELSWVDGILPNKLNEFCELLFDFSEKYALDKPRI